MEGIDYTIDDTIVSIKNMENREGIKISKDEVFTALELTKCNCGKIWVNTGIKSTKPLGCECGECHKIISSTNILSDARGFKKLDTLVDISEVEEIFKKEPFEL